MLVGVDEVPIALAVCTLHQEMVQVALQVIFLQVFQVQAMVEQVMDSVFPQEEA